MHKLYTAANLIEAHLLSGYLRQSGVAVVVLNEHAQGGLGEIPFTQAYPEVWLLEESQLPRAREALASYRRAGRNAPPRTCLACGESNPGTFEVCWRCAAPLMES